MAMLSRLLAAGFGPHPSWRAAKVKNGYGLQREADPRTVRPRRRLHIKTSNVTRMDDGNSLSWPLFGVKIDR